jgi:hypothetical protein
MTLIQNGMRLSARRQYARDTADIVAAARQARASLVNVVKLAERRRREAIAIDDQGFEVIDWQRLTPEDQRQSLYSALTWLQQAETQVRQTRVLLEKALERSERRAL